MIFDNFFELLGASECEAFAPAVTHNADDLGVSAVSGYEHRDIGRGIFADYPVYFLDKRAGGVADVCARRLEAAVYARPHSVSADDYGSPRQRFHGRVYHPNALFLKILYNDRVMYQRAEGRNLFPALDELIGHFDRAVDSEAKACGFCNLNPFHGPFQAALLSCP